MLFQKLINLIAEHPQKIFLIDGYGALLSSFLYLAVLANWESFFGIPKKPVYFMAFLAGIYAVYSFMNYLAKKENWQPYLKIIAVANLLHCGLVIGLGIHYFQSIRIPFFIYFAIEFAIVIPLAIWEWNTASKSL